MAKHLLPFPHLPDSVPLRHEVGIPSASQELLSKLTVQETSIYLHLLQGMKRRHIAMQMAISPKTYDAHRANMLRKAGAATSHQVACA